MIGWTKTRKRCKEHGLVLRKRSEYCPACGQQLTVVSVPYLFQVYFHPAIAIVPGIIVLLFGMFVFLDVRGCRIERTRRANVRWDLELIESQKMEEQARQILLTMPSQWKTLYTGMDSIYYRSEKWRAMRDYFRDNPEIRLPKLKPEQLRLFLDMLGHNEQDNAFALIVKHMQTGASNE